MTWYWRESDLPYGRAGWTPYEESISNQLTQARNAGKSQVIIQVLGGQKYVVHLTEPMAQHPEGRENLLRSVKFVPALTTSYSSSSAATSGRDSAPASIPSISPNPGSLHPTATPTGSILHHSIPSYTPYNQTMSSVLDTRFDLRTEPTQAPSGGSFPQRERESYPSSYVPLGPGPTPYLAEPENRFDANYRVSSNQHPQLVGQHGRTYSEPTFSSPSYAHAPVHSPSDPYGQPHATSQQQFPRAQVPPGNAYGNAVPGSHPSAYYHMEHDLGGKVQTITHATSPQQHQYQQQHQYTGDYVDDMQTRSLNTGSIHSTGTSSMPAVTSFTNQGAPGVGRPIYDPHDGFYQTHEDNPAANINFTRTLDYSDQPEAQLVHDCFHAIQVNRLRQHTLAELHTRILQQLGGAENPIFLSNLFERLATRSHTHTADTSRLGPRQQLAAPLPTVTASSYLIHASTAVPSWIPRIRAAGNAALHGRPAPASADQVPSQWKLWEQEVVLTNHAADTAQWEILAPTSADQFAFFTCIQQLEGTELEHAHVLAETKPNTIVESFRIKGTIAPQQSIKLTFSFVLFSQLKFQRMVLIDFLYPTYSSTCPISISLEGIEDTSITHWSVPTSLVVRGPFISKGSFGSVYMATIRGLQCAMKIWTCPKAHDAAKGTFTVPMPLDFKKELAVFHVAKHRHLIPFIGAYHNLLDTEAFILLKFASSGSLDRYYKARREAGLWTNYEAFKLALESARGLQRLHAVGVLHRDVKSLNILVDDGEARITDFGAARIASSPGTTTMQSEVKVHGTPYWVAPEVMANGVPEYTKATDVFSFGLVLFELATGQLPTRDDASYRAGAFPPLPSVFSQQFPEYRLLYLSCVARDPRQRPSFDSIVSSLEALEARQRKIEPPTAKKLATSAKLRGTGVSLDPNPVDALSTSSSASSSAPTSPAASTSYSPSSTTATTFASPPNYHAAQDHSPTVTSLNFQPQFHYSSLSQPPRQPPGTYLPNAYVAAPAAPQVYQPYAGPTGAAASSQYTRPVP